MKKRELLNLGIEGKKALTSAEQVCRKAAGSGMKKKELRKRVSAVVEDPESHADCEIFGQLARSILNQEDDETYKLKSNLDYACWGEDIQTDAHKQMRNACSLPVSVKAALMPDAHVGYGLPIGGVLATRNAVIPYAVGVDIACRVMLSVFDWPLDSLQRKKNILEKAIEDETRFGIGAKFKNRKNHDVLDYDWGFCKFVKDLKDIAWRQLGTSGSGNHFVEFGEFEVFEDLPEIKKGTYPALVSHSGSRGTGAKIATHYSKVARAKHPDLPKSLQHLAWLGLEEADGQEYWQAMELMGAYASANHHVIHKEVLKNIGAKPLYQMENHHNFAWKEVHDGEELVVHRKGATPAAAGERGYIPGSMLAPGYLVEGKGNEEALRSCAHGAGRQMSRSKAKHSTTKHALLKTMKENDISLLSAGLDESPHAYKDIEAVMQAQSSLVKTLARFQPRIVKMAPEGERPED